MALCIVIENWVIEISKTLLETFKIHVPFS
jgi:hypothetical protein